MNIPKISAPPTPNVTTLSPKIPVAPVISTPNIPKIPSPNPPSLQTSKVALPTVSVPKTKLPSPPLPPRADGLSGITGGLKKPNFASVQSSLGGLVGSGGLPKLPTSPNIGKLISDKLTTSLPTD